MWPSENQLFSCKISGDWNEGTPLLLLMLKPASQCHKHDCIKHALLITLSKESGSFRKTESKSAICAILLLWMWGKRTWKGEKKKALNVVIAVLLGLLSPPCFLLPTVHTTSCCCQQCTDIASAVQERGRNAGFFSPKDWFQSKWGECPTATWVWKIPGFSRPHAL